MANQGIIRTAQAQPQQEQISPFRQALSKSLIRVGTQLFEQSLEAAHARGGKPAEFDFSGVSNDLINILETRWTEKEYENWMNAEFKPAQEEANRVRSGIHARSSALMEGKVLDVNGNMIGEFDPKDQLQLMRHGQNLITEYHDIAAKIGDNYANSAMKYPDNPLIQQQVASVFQRYSAQTQEMLGGAVENAKQQLDARLTEARISDLYEQAAARGREAKEKEPRDMFDYVEKRGVPLESLPTQISASPEAKAVFLKSGGMAYMARSEDLTRQSILAKRPSLAGRAFDEGSRESLELEGLMARNAPATEKRAIGMYLEDTFGKRLGPQFESVKTRNPDYFTVQVATPKKTIMGGLSSSEVKQVAQESLPDATAQLNSLIRTGTYKSIDEAINAMMRDWWPQFVRNNIDAGAPNTEETIEKLRNEVVSQLRTWAKQQEYVKEKGLLPKSIIERGAEQLGGLFGGTTATPLAPVPTSILERPKKKPKKGK